jgi:hypothetical protein
MASLRFSGGAVIFTWIYCILWWFLQDACKVAAYYCIDNYLDLPPTEHTSKEMGLKSADSNAEILDGIEDHDDWQPAGPASPMKKVSSAIGRLLGSKNNSPASSRGNRVRSTSRITTVVANPVAKLPAGAAAPTRSSH